ncbi:MAG: acetate/propionate family kinase [Sphaerochaetaceae bacterium]|nr:acetate/propionate family kinase [Sphaerochaetaceae bacterium]
MSKKSMKILVCNAGSTSLKFKLFDMPCEHVMATGNVERVGSSDDAVFRYENMLTKAQVNLKHCSILDYKAGIGLFTDCLTSDENGVIQSFEEIERVGFKTVICRTCFSTHELTEEIIQGMRDWEILAPVHTRAYIESINAMKKTLPGAMMVGVFETDFHKTIPFERRIYGVPYRWYEELGIQRLGFHGASHRYVAECLSAQKQHYRAISCHLGGSGSICAILDGRSIDTSFGMSLETGLIHANRVGDMDPTMIFYLEQSGLKKEEIMDGLQKTGGLYGISGVSGDLRYVEKASAQGNERAKLALDAYVNGIVHYIGAFAMDLEGLDDLVFTAGIGEHSAVVRRAVCDKLLVLGVRIDESKNQSNCPIISTDSSDVVVHIIPTDEELVVARRTFEAD